MGYRTFTHSRQFVDWHFSVYLCFKGSLQQIDFVWVPMADNHDLNYHDFNFCLEFLMRKKLPLEEMVQSEPVNLIGL